MQIGLIYERRNYKVLKFFEKEKSTFKVKALYLTLL